MLLHLLAAAAMGITQPWLYSTVSNRGPAQWGTMRHTNTGDVLYGDCAGNQQSPIQIEEAVIDDTLLPLLYAYVTTSDYTVRHLRAFVRIEFTSDAGSLSDFNLGGKKFDLKYIDIHAPAEHSVEEGLSDVELQLVHTASATGQPDAASAYPQFVTLITAILVNTKSSVEHTFFTSFLDKIPSVPISAANLYSTDFSEFTETSNTGVTPLDMTSILPVPWSTIRQSSKEREYFTYDGSFTSPIDGCAQSVKWYVYAHTISTTAAQVALLREKLGLVEEAAVAASFGFPIDNCEVFGNNRPVQALNGRVVRMYSVSGIAEVGSVVGATDTSIVATKQTCDDILQQPWLYAEVSERGPARWSTVAAQNSGIPLYPSCGGAEQSPISLSTGASVVDKTLAPLDFQYGTATGYTIQNDGAAIFVTFATPAGYVVDTNTQKRYELTHVVFRTPSEHSIEGGHYEMEMQLMHRDSTGQVSGVSADSKYLGVAVLFKADGPDHEFLKDLWGQLQQRPRSLDEQYTSPYGEFQATKRTGLSEPLSLAKGLPADRGYYTYDGSLTQPPCTEKARWYVFTTANTMSLTQIAAISGAMNYTGELKVAQEKGFIPQRCATFGNNRPIQPLGTRVVKRTEAAANTPGKVFSAHQTDVDCKDQTWLYADVLNRGPTSWGAIKSPTTNTLLFPTCGSGVSQSPVRIDKARIDETLVPLVYSYVQGREFTVQNWQNMMKVVFTTSPGYITNPNMGNMKFNLVEFQLHAPSQHAVGTGLRQLELIMVHEADGSQPTSAQSFASTKWLHVSVLFETEATDNIFLSAFWGSLQNLPVTPSTLFANPQDSIEPRISGPISPAVDLTGGLPKVQDFFSYTGSKTAPPCTEGVQWYVYTTPSGISAGQLAQFKSKMGFNDELSEAKKNQFTAATCETYGNNRPVQVANGRTVSMYSKSGVAHEGAVQGATEPPPANIPAGTTITTSTSDVVQLVDVSQGGGQGDCGAGGTGYQPWGYADVAQRGPENWGTLTSQGGGAALFPTCTAGEQQSPLNMNATHMVTDLNLQPLVFSYNTICEMNVENNQRSQVITVRAAPWHTGTTTKRSANAQAEPPDRTPSPIACTDARSLGYVQDPNLGSKRFELNHIEFHAPSEHAIEGGLYDMEVQFHHREAIGQPANANIHDEVKRVSVAVLFQVREADNPVLEKFFQHMRPTPLQPSTLYTSAWQSFTSQTAEVQTTFSAQELIPPASEFITYAGSITVPPCTEGVQWYVYTTPLEVGRKQLALFRELMGFEEELTTAKGMGFSPSKCSTFGNNRPVQPVNTRVLKKSGTVAKEASGPVTSVHFDDERCSVLPWLYTEGDNRGPTSWGAMTETVGAAPLYPDCAAGNSKEQSPVDISAAQLDETLKALEYTYPQQVGYVVENNQKNGRVSFENTDGTNGHITDPNLGMKRYDLHNLHFHSPSEHSVNGGLYDMEMHIVHRESGPAVQPQGVEGFSKYRDLVVTVLFEVTALDNPWLESFWAFLQTTPLTAEFAHQTPYAGFHKRSSTVIEVPLNVHASLPSSREYFTYDGSFTEPPCTEGVKWYVYTTPVGISQTQLNNYRQSLNLTGELTEAAKKGYHPKPCTTFGNNRPTQPLNTRTIKMSSDAGVAPTGIVSGATKTGGWSAISTSGTCEEPATQQPWLYTEANSRGPSQWSTVTAPAGAPLYPTCNTGTQQSPANMEEAVVDNALKALVYKYSQGATYTVVNNQASVHLEFKAGSMGAMQDPNNGDTRYEVTGITFKAPSEHTVGGRHFDAEMQISHKKATGQPGSAVGPEFVGISVFFESQGDTKNEWIDAFWGSMPSDPVSQESLYGNPYQLFQNNKQVLERTLDIANALPASKEYFTYEGSETAPPCTEGKRWYVYSNPQRISESQVSELRNALGLGQEASEAAKAGVNILPCTQVGNVRPAQPLKARQVRMKSTGGVPPMGKITGATDSPIQTASATCGVGAVHPWHYAEVNNRGPTLWASLQDSKSTTQMYPTCAGQEQSPIALDVPFIDSTLQDLSYTYSATGTENTYRIENDMAKLKMTFMQSPGWIEDPNQSNRKYVLSHIEFHTPSEHTIEGGKYSMEVMLYHQVAVSQGTTALSGTKYVVVSVFFQVRTQSESSWLKAFFDKLPLPPISPEKHFENPFEPITARASASFLTVLDLSQVLPTDRALFAYDGSHSAPPCEEGVKRYIYSTPQVMSTTQYDQLRTAIGADDMIKAAEARGVQVLDKPLFGNSRPVQAKNSRVVRYTSGSTIVQPPLTRSPPGTTPTPTGPAPPVVVPEVAYLVVQNISIVGMTQANINALTVAATQDLAGAFGTSTSRISLQIMDHASSNGSVFFYSVNTENLVQPELLLANIQKAYLERTITLPRTEAAYASLTGENVDANVDVEKSAVVTNLRPFVSSMVAAVTNVDLSKVTDTQKTVLAEAARYDLAAQYEVHPSRVTARMVDAVAPVWCLCFCFIMLPQWWLFCCILDSLSLPPYSDKKREVCLCSLSSATDSVMQCVSYEMFV